MKKIMLFMLTLSLSLVACSQENNENIEEDKETIVSSNIKVMTFNVFGGFPRGANRNDIKDYDLESIIETIKKSDSDIIGLNEISNNHKAATNYENQPEIIAN